MSEASDLTRTGAPMKTRFGNHADVHELLYAPYNGNERLRIDQGTGERQ